MKITWLGHSCFKVEFSNNTVIFDPYSDGSVPGLKPIHETADCCICSHEHADHFNQDGVKISGIKKNFSIKQINTFHDPEKGKLRGKNIISIVSDGKKKIAHMGDIGCELTVSQISELKDMDVVMIPVGGFYTINGNEAAEIIKKINPKLVIPMHFKNMDLCFGYDCIDCVDTFLDNFDQDDIEISDKSTVDIDYNSKKIVVLKPLML